ncbi:YegP family protein [Devosia albogilva]|uniref:YegP family protein n=1 Tax=Devosia albogilva TaxID=429726 RepID=A0ABW5QLA3_9HYPH
MFEILRANAGGYFWRLKGANGETLCHSEVYTSKQAAETGIAAVKRVAPTAPVNDRT